MIEDLVTTVGLPAAMCIWFMYRTDKVIQNNTVALGKNTEALNIYHSKIKKK